MAHPIIALGTLSGFVGFVGLAAGAALQQSTSPILNTIGQITLVGGLLNVSVGLAVVSTQWRRWRQETHALANLSKMEMTIGQGLLTNQMDVLKYAALGERCTQVFEHSTPTLAREIVQRMDTVGFAIVQKIDDSDKNAARAAIAYTMSGIRLGLGQPGSLVSSIDPLNTSLAYKTAPQIVVS